ncbi:MAG: hypothetical protein IKL78_04900 [Lachnospiraceae bacterium]|nr:hypothetical protein [Lachnospiraceae bacterium]
MRIKNKERFWFCSLVGLVTLMFIWRVPYGNGGWDEPFYLTLADRVVKGDALLSEEWHPTQLTGFLLAPIMALYRLFVHTTEGILVNFRYIYVVYHVAVTFGIYHILKKYKYLRMIAALFYMLYIPLQIMNFSYNSIGLSMTVISMLLLMTMERFSIVRCIGIGIAFAIATIACPHQAALYAVYTLVIAVLCIKSAIQKKFDKELLKTWGFITIGISIVSVIFAVFILSRASINEILTNLKFILDDTWHSIPFKQKVLDYKSALFFIYGNYIWIWLAIPVVALLDRGRSKRTWIYFPVMAVTVIINIIQNWNAEGSNYVMFPIVFLGLLAFILLKEKDWKTFFIGYVGGFLYTFCKHLSSMLRMDAICLASVLMGIVAVLYIGQLFVQVKQEMKKVGWLLCVSVASFFTIQISSQIYMDMTTSYWMESIWGENQTLTEGPLKGVIMEKSKAASDVLSLNDIKFVKDLPAGKILFVAKRTWYHLYADMEYGTPSAWCEVIDDSLVLRIMDYFELHPDKKADYIYIGAGEGWDYSSVERIAPYYGYGKVTFTNRGCFLERTEY